MNDEWFLLLIARGQIWSEGERERREQDPEAGVRFWSCSSMSCRVLPPPPPPLQLGYWLKWQQLAGLGRGRDLPQQPRPVPSHNSGQIWQTVISTVPANATNSFLSSLLARAGPLLSWSLQPESRSWRGPGRISALSSHLCRGPDI